MPRLSLEDQRWIIDRLTQLIVERVRSETSTRAGWEARQATLHEQFTAERQRLLVRQQAERTEFQSRYTNSLTRVTQDLEATIEEALNEQDRANREASAAAEKDVARAGVEWQETRDRLGAEFDADVRELSRSLQEFKEKVEQHRAELRALEVDAEGILRRRYCLRKAREGSVPAGSCDLTNPVASYTASLAAAREAVQALAAHKLPTFLFTFVVLMFPVLVVTLGMLAAGLLVNPSAGGGEGVSAPPTLSPENMVSSGRSWGTANEDYLTFAAGGAVVLGLMSMVYVVVRPVVIGHTREGYRLFRRHVADADTSLDAATKLRAADADSRKIQLKQQLAERLRQLDAAHKERLEAIATRRETRIRSAAELQQQKRKSASDTRNARQRSINEQFARQSEDLGVEHDAQSFQFEQRQQQELATSREMFDRGWSRLVSHWKGGVAEANAALDEMWFYCRSRFPDWHATDWETWRPPDESLAALQFGSYAFRLDAVEGGIPEHEDLRPDRLEFPIPAVMSFADRPALLFETWDEGRPVASRAMQNAMLRLLTSLPPGKVRFTIIDPIGLGQNFSAFMHLADFDEKLINHRIWTEPSHINQRLTDLTEHMEDVIQTYLRNEFPTIDEYNRQAGEVAEPFHVLVVANFPAGFNEETSQRLLSIITSGARCGVYTLISTDAKLEWPRNLSVADLEARATTLQWNGSRFSWRDEVLKDLPLVLDEPPTDERLTHIIRVIGRKAKDASRVEVPFTTVAAKPGSWWSHDSRGGIEVALGRAGASKLQFLRLGHGTSQHVLMSGKTGSGKSTLLHALITNTAIHYSPDEVEFYLIDFKKGVEFKPYASRHLPHARVVAIESEREFGMSVLERLDQELRVRGDLFRETGVHDIKSFRDGNPTVRMPRVLLVIDEFQEFFTQDDKLSQDAALLLDRLVRQGRAFGIHVLLGSQTLAGAYSLARSTLGQMAVRIALQCSEADSHLILSEDNTAARLLSRPGEAIYNDANGLFEGNHPFQIVWLSASEQEQYLAQLSGMDRQQRGEPTRLIVFEGNAPADPAENAPLRRLIELAEPAESPLAPRAWLGAAVAIKDPTAAVFRRQSGANLLLVGQQEEAALGMLANCVISLQAAFSNGNGSRARFVVLDGTRLESPESGWWWRFAQPWPLSLDVAPPAEASARIAELAAEVARRMEAGAEAESPVFLLIHNLARFRELRRGDDDFGFSLDQDKPASPGKQLLNLLRDGPSVGVHGLAWCDTFNTVNRWFDRATLREFDQRVLLQMSANDSSNLMDSPAASRLGQFRALLYSEEQGQYEKFRPYGIPSPEWLAWVHQQLVRAANEVV